MAPHEEHNRSLPRMTRSFSLGQVREDMFCSRVTPSYPCPTLARTVLRRSAAPPRTPRPPWGGLSLLTAMPVATDIATRPRRASVRAHVGLPPGPAARG